LSEKILPPLRDDQTLPLVLSNHAHQRPRLGRRGASGGLQTGNRLGVMLLPNGSRLKSSFIAPCLPRRTEEPPRGPGWIHEIKHDGFRIMARRDERGVRLFTRNGYDFADRFPLIARAVEALPAHSCFIDGEAIVVDSTGLSVFDLLRYRQHDGAAVLCAFDLIGGRGLRTASAS
jgi:ATP-dependent DNA ligase